LTPEDWEVKELKFVIDIKHGFAFKGEFFTDEPNEHIVLTPGNFNIGGGFKAQKFKYYLSDYPEEYALKEGDIVVSMTDLSKGGDTLGYSAKIPPSKEKTYLHNQRLCLLQFKSKKIYPDFIYWLLRTKKYQQFVVSSATGSTVKHTSPTRIKEYKFAYPSLSEQTAIAKILSDLDSKIELLQKQNKTLEAIGQAIFKHWFVDFEFPNVEGKPYKSSGGEMVFNDELGKAIPKGWEVGTVEELCISINNGGTPRRMEKRYWDGGSIPWYKTGELEQNTILIALYASPTVGRLGILKTTATSNQACSGLLAKNEVGYSYLFHTLLSKREEFNSISVGSAQQNISQQIVKKSKVVIPPSEITLVFQEITEPIFDKRTLLISESITISKIRDTFLPKLMSGEIRVGS
jgi:type I restriction enzyme S subunit